MDADDQRRPTTRPEDERMGRRVFLGMMGAGAVGLVVGDGVLSVVGRASRPLTDALPEGVRAALPAPGGGWRIYTVNPPMPRFDPATWRLTIDGLVERPMTLTHAQLLALPRVEQTSDFYCVTGWSVLGVRWTGVRFADLLAAARPLPRATALRFVSAERPYVDMLTMKQAMVDDAMLAYGMDGRPMPRPHGAPARVVMPKMYGYKGVKWVERIELVDRVEPGFWEQRGYDRDPWLNSEDAV
ncbi:molybdopterin-dependent oxidoreductase [Conexibacter sp. W3-3-2]|uniref:molybdopterin-dependent oxidoreductase n=1 Tax=Conexibacter sp. W3-3-2 TaxID=2675227 RepID=UPI0012B6E1A8|nr:molybdopterin-dependent oxidoreductase [Conexibacter sp. W3-3-2]MTD44798.1 molybdopterin-dependent oxidoreductase [Conexibacter sp. W3-3-2]